MSRVIFETLEQLVADVGPRDERSPFLVVYRKQEFFCLAVDEETAIAAVAASNGYEAGLVPLPLVIAAARNAGGQVAGASGGNPSGGKNAAESETAKSDLPDSIDASFRNPLVGLTDAELQHLDREQMIEACNVRGIDVPAKTSKPALVKLLRDHREEVNGGK